MESYEVCEAPADCPPAVAPCPEDELTKAKMYLQTFCPDAGDSIYNHISLVLNRILAERPSNPFAVFDELHRRLKDDKFRLNNDYLQKYHPTPSQIENAKKILRLYRDNVKRKREGEEDDDCVDDDEEAGDEEQGQIEVPNLFEKFYYFEKVGVTLHRPKQVLLSFSIRQLIAKTKITDARFWGKILGRKKHYYVVEGKLSDEDLERRLQEAQQLAEEGEICVVEPDDDEKNEVDEECILDGEGESAKSSESLKLVFPPLPENTWKAPPEVSAEALGTGLNSKIYYVCNSPGLDDWVELPEVTPQQIVAARQILYVCTGNLEAEIYTFPPFPGCEKNYLRAQIARIGAATQVSPIGYFSFGRAGDDDGEEFEDDAADGDEDEEGEGGELKVNRRYEPLPPKELIDPSNWCHHGRFILRQGREKWLKPGLPDGYESGDEEEEEEEEEEGEEGEEEAGSGSVDSSMEKEIGPQLLMPLSEDVATGCATPWTGRLAFTAQPDTAVVLMRSNLWPGAFAYAADKKCGNLYVGWALKHEATNYNPAQMPEIQEQYMPIGEELVERQDPSFEEEEAYRIAHLPSEPDGEEAEEEDLSDEEDDDV